MRLNSLCEKEEIAVLKKQVKTLKCVMYGGMCLLAVGITVAATSIQDVTDGIKAKEFKLIDDKGATLAILGPSAEGNGGLVVFNKDEKITAIIGAGPDGGIVGLRNKSGQNAAILTAVPDGGQLMTFNTKNGTPGISIGSSSDGGSLSIFNENGKRTFDAAQQQEEN